MLNIIPWILTIILYTPVFLSLYKGAWEVRDYTHAYFILPVSLFIAWTKRKEIARLAALRQAQGCKGCKGSGFCSFLLLLFGLLMFIFGWRQEYLLIQALSLLPVLYGMISFVYSPALAKILRFPVLYLLLLVPPPSGILDNITLPMRHISSVVSAAVLKMFHYPITREGLMLTMGGHEIYMGAPCSGFRSLITMFSLGLIYIYFNQGKWSKNFILFLSITPLALAGNFIRIIALCLITFYFGAEAGQGFMHDFSGIVVFVIIIFGMIVLENLLEKK